MKIIKKDRRAYIVLLFVTFFFCSCQEDEFLVQSDPNGVTGAVFAETIMEVDASLASVYEGLRGHRVADVGPGNLISDIVFPGRRGAVGQFFQHLDFINYNLTSSSTQIAARWRQLYQVIFRANLTLGFVEKGRENGLDKSELIIIEAQAKFLRALAHFYVYNTFNEGNIILRVQPNPTFNSLSVNVTPADQVIKAIREDFTFAYNNLPLKNDSEYLAGRITAGAAAMLLANTYLYEGEFDKAIPFYEEIVNESAKFGFALLTNETELLNMFSDEGEYNSESILEIEYNLANNLQQTQWEEDSFHNRLGVVVGPPILNSQARLVPSNWLTVEYLEDHLKFTDADKTDPAVYNTVSLRASSMVAMVNDTRNPYYQSEVPAQHFSFDRLPAVFRKYTNWDNSTGEINSKGSAWKSGKNVILNRLPEAYLNLAECYLKGASPRVDEAIELINVIRRRWKIAEFKLDPGSAISELDQVMNHIMYVEKPLELSLEGSHARSIDIRRWGIAKERFEALSKEDGTSVRDRYKLAPYEYTTADGETATRARSTLVPIADGEDVEDSNNNKLDVEFTVAAQRYTNGYYPLPTIETDFNENIK
ncbi:RagB/SusD family nutrient uptake outer membrane protein [Aquimarina agarilytica]|uniref:RagB/SusD family nutrient uptake outer membrane protein n=1 Tax=Aquimarina agarilytica TaxID=1087449 RepID=UPI0002893469|nr:RagB/SusD family nutrient uptake outer membrane protein [Aquimarina agarilytica]